MRTGTNGRSRAWLLLVPLAALLLAGGCSSPFTLVQLVDGPEGQPLSVAPDGGTILANESVMLIASGGYPPYDYELVSGRGTLTENVYVAPASSTTAEIRVTDTVGNSLAVELEVDASAVPLGITPSTQSVFTGGAVTFAPIGGTGPFSFALSSDGSGGAGVNASSGEYTAGPQSGTDTVTVTDASDGATATATVNVQAYDLAINPSTSTITTPGSLDFEPIGGTGPFTFALTTDGSGGATVNSTTGAYSPGPLAGTDLVTMTDEYDGRTVSATVSVERRELSVNPTSVTLTTEPASNTVVFAPVGGTGPFSFAITTNNSGATINGSTGEYIAGAVAGSDTVTLTDDYDGRTVSATVTVIGGTFTADVDYEAGVPTISGNTPKLGGAVAADATVSNLGSAAGAEDLNWYAYASPDTTVGGTRDYLIDSGTIAGGLAAAGSAPVAISGTWPETQSSYYLLFQVEAADDVQRTNNTAASAGQTYVTTPVSISPTAMSVYTGQEIQFVADGEGSGFTWDLQTDATGGSVDTAGLYTAGSSPGTDEVRVTDNYDGSQTVATVTVVASPVSDTVEYVIDSITVDPGTTNTGDPLSGTVDITNSTAGSGGEPISYSLYASEGNDTLGGDVLVYTGTTPGLGPGASVSAPFSGAWPAVPGDYYLIATISAIDEISTTGNQFATATPTAVADPPPADVDYYVSTPPSGGARSPSTITPLDSPLSETFTVTNAGSAAGTANIYWNAYLSQDDSYGPGDILVDSGVIAPGFTGADPVAPTTISGAWPLDTDPWPYYLIVRLSAADDLDAADNTAASPPYNQDVTGRDYAVTLITRDHPTDLAGAPIRESFTVTNIGDANGQAADLYDWTVYVSTDATLTADEIVDSGTGYGPLNAGVSQIVPVQGVWPFSPDTYGLYVEIMPTGTDVDSSNHLRSQGPFTIDGPPDYTVDGSGIAASGNGEPGTALDLNGSFSFIIENIAPDPGNEPVTWQVFASPDSALGTNDILLASDVIAPLGAGSPSPPIDFGATTWTTEMGDPLSGLYQIFAVVNADDDEVPGNNTFSYGPVKVPYVYTEAGEPNDDLNSPPLSAPNINTYAGSPADPSGELDPYELYEIVGYDDADGGPSPDDLDAYAISVHPDVSTLRVYAEWATGADDIDFYVESSTMGSFLAQDLASDREPGSGWFEVTGWGGDPTIYISVLFLDTIAPAEYRLYVHALP